MLTHVAELKPAIAVLNVIFSSTRTPLAAKISYLRDIRNFTYSVTSYARAIHAIPAITSATE